MQQGVGAAALRVLPGSAVLVRWQDAGGRAGGWGGRGGAVAAARPRQVHPHAGQQDESGARRSGPLTHQVRHAAFKVLLS